MNSLFRKLLFGDAAIREYATISVDGPIWEKVYLQTPTETLHVSGNQFLLCLNPVVFGVWLEDADQINLFNTGGTYKMHFSCKTITSKKVTPNLMAEVTLEFFDKIEEPDGTLMLLKEVKSVVRHINRIKTWLLFARYYKKPGFSFEQLKALASAYSFPRRVRIVSFKQGDYYNIFPMDLLGDIAHRKRYVMGLRHTNTALARMVEARKVVISEVPFKYKETIYKLGSHHSTQAPPVEGLPFKVITSKNYGFYVPEWADSYKELAIKKTINLGSHMLLWAEVQHECELKASTGHLFHIHYLLYLFQKRKGLLYPEV